MITDRAETHTSQHFWPEGASCDDAYIRVGVFMGLCELLKGGELTQVCCMMSP